MVKKSRERKKKRERESYCDHSLSQEEYACEILFRRFVCENEYSENTCSNKMLVENKMAIKGKK